MISCLPPFIPALFILISLFTVWMFFKASDSNVRLLSGILIWLILQGTAGYLGFYENTSGTPPRFILLIAPPVLLIVFLFFFQGGRNFLDTLDLRRLTWLHTVRFFVELVIYWLYVYRQLPLVMTFDGRNLDIFSGITAPVVAWFGFSGLDIRKRLLLIWNIVCLGLLLNIVITAVLSAPFSFQKMGFDQPNVAVLYFPFVWLPCCVVPIVLVSHLAAIRQLSSGLIGPELKPI